ncbi:RNA polymerase sigma factor [Gorillibacterium massiliense]|uniref:RNA polymerase sigma factor n=1 Tax=Gorillibacterium massiliense TaxID=1280390 RepID=UPI0004B97642|nr:RNA polymerase sigma factor [Gorillibacterium massiliense]
MTTLRFTAINEEASPDRNDATDLERTRSKLYRYCLTLTGASWEAEDLVQITCLRGMPVLTGMVPHPNPEAYLLRIARNLWVDESRRRLRERQLTVNMAAADRADDSEGGDEVLNGILAEEALQALFDLLSPQQRGAFLLREICGYTGAEAAQLLNATEGSVKAALRRARIAIEAYRHSNEGELHSGETSDEIEKEQLTAYLTAIRSGDTEQIVRLVQSDVLDPVVGYSFVMNKSGKIRASLRKSRIEAGLVRSSFLYCLAA